jgi:prepilin-type N-terminal cleavage/methylation domain-containing protein/prepilin-type processing-associated H-X9-DG protein
MHHRRGLGFTLIELLVVISVIALLIAILLPALGAARQTAVAIQCAANQKQLGIMTAIYMDENRGRIHGPWDRAFEYQYQWHYVAPKLWFGRDSWGPTPTTPEHWTGWENWNNIDTLPLLHCPTTWAIMNPRWDVPNGGEDSITARTTFSMAAIDDRIILGGDFDWLPPADRRPAIWNQAQIVQASATVFFMDRTSEGAGSDPFDHNAPAWARSADVGVRDIRPHPGESSNFLYFDGHVERHITPNLTTDQKRRMFDHFGDGW